MFKVKTNLPQELALAQELTLALEEEAQEAEALENHLSQLAMLRMTDAVIRTSRAFEAFAASKAEEEAEFFRGRISL